MASPTKAVGYVRMSTDKQDTSPEQQRIEIERYAAAHDYGIVNWYEDLGISGDNTAKRVGFQKMIADGSCGGFDAILVWDQDRFGRFDMIEAGRWIHPLREAGVHLASVTDGRVDWSDMAGRLVYSVKQEGKHQFLRDLSNNVSRKMRQMAEAGQWTTGKPPIGYDVTADRRLVLGLPADVKLVRHIFRRYIDGESTRAIAGWLAAIGKLSPKGTRWTANGIQCVLKNEIYTGRLVQCRMTFSKYRKANPKRYREQRPAGEWVVIPDNHPAIIDRETFVRANEIMKSRRKNKTDMVGGTYALSGLLRCVCGARMTPDGSNGVRSYTCHTYHQRPTDCERFNVREAATLPLILKALRTEYFDKYLGDEARARLRQEMERQLTEADADAEIHEDQIRQIEHKIEQAEARLLEVSPDMVRRVEDRIRQLEDQRDEVAMRMTSRKKPAAKLVTDVEKRIGSAWAWLDQMEEIVSVEYDPKLVGMMLRQFIDGVDLQMERVPWGPSGKRFKTEITGGTIYFKSGQLTRLGDR